MASGGDETTSERRRSTHIKTPQITPTLDGQARCIFCKLNDDEAKKTIRNQRWVQCSKCDEWMHISCLDWKMGKKGTVPKDLWSKIHVMQDWNFCCPENCGDHRTIPEQLETQHTFTREELLAMGVRKGHLGKPATEIYDKQESESAKIDESTKYDQIDDEQLDEEQKTDVDSDSDHEEKLTQEEQWRRAGAKPKADVGAGFTRSLPQSPVAPPTGGISPAFAVPSMAQGPVAPSIDEYFSMANRQQESVVPPTGGYFPMSTVPQAPVTSTSGMNSMMDFMQLMFSQMQQTQKFMQDKDEKDRQEREKEHERREREKEKENERREREKEKEHERREREREKEHERREREQKMMWENIQQLQQPSVTPTPPHSVRHTKVKLPTVELPKFDGNILKWKEFWDIYENLIHNDPDISNIEKFSFLKGSLVGAAAAEIEACRITDDNYDAVIQRLKDRFDNEGIIKEQLFLQLQNMPISGTKATELRQAYNTITSIYSQMSKMGHSLNDTDLLMVMQKFPPPVRQKLGERKDPDTKWTFITFRNSLDGYIRNLEETWATREIQAQNARTVTKTAKPRSHPPIAEHSEQFRGRGSGAGLVAVKTGKNFTGRNFDRKPAVSNTNTSVNSERVQRYPCAFCNGWGHYSECTKVTSIKDRRQLLTDAKRCFICLKPGHSKGECMSRKGSMPCYGCGQKGMHHQSICSAWLSRRQAGHQSEQTGFHSGQVAVRAMTDNNDAPVLPNGTGISAATTLDSQKGASMIVAKPKIILQTATVSVFNPAVGKKISANVLLDNGSTDTWVTENLARRLNLPKKQKRTLNITSFNSLEPAEIQGYETEIGFMIKGQRELICTAMIKDNLTGLIARHPIGDKDKEYLRTHPKVELAMGAVPDSISLYNVDIIIGQEYFWDFMTNKKKVTLPSGLKLLPSRFGYLIGGKSNDVHGTQLTSPSYVATRLSYSFHAITTHKKDDKTTTCIEDLWNLDSIGIKDCPVVNDDDKALEKFNDTIRFENGRYHVTWMWKSDSLDLPENKGVAWGRFRSLTTRLRSDRDLLTKYDAVIQDQLNKGIIEKVTDDSETGPRHHYLPHHPVITPQKTTTKVRIVYDASAREKKGANSLNDCMYRGPVMLPDLCGLLLRFRMSPIAILADIEKAFLQVGLQTPDRDVTRFLWYKDVKNPRVNEYDVYRFCRVAFGIICSPFLLEATIRYHLNKVGTPLAEAIGKNIYVDNVFIGAKTPEECGQIYQEAKRIFQDISMNLREWASNCPDFQQYLPIAEHIVEKKSKILGLKWNIDDDTIQVPGLDDTKYDGPVTKRHVLQTVAKIFDPLGFFNPVLFYGKIFLRTLWDKEIKWDDELDKSLVAEWQTVEEILRQITTVTIPRFPGDGATDAYDLLTFCDASKDVYATAVYLKHQLSSIDKIQTSGLGYKTTLVFSKLRLAAKVKNSKTGLKETITLPRLELLGVLIGVRATEFVTKQLGVSLRSRVLFTDSQVVMGWIKSVKKQPVFIENRLKEIREVEGLTFRHVSSEDNPADLLTRGLTVPELTDFWWNGSTWLCNRMWPTTDEVTSDQLNEILSETPKENSVYLQAPSWEGPSEIDEFFDKIFDRFSSFRKLVGTIGYCLRLKKMIKKGNVTKGPLSATEREEAESFLVKIVQYRGFPKVIDDIKNDNRNNLQQQLGLYLDTQDCLRCYGRLGNAEVSYDTKYPRLLPSKSKFTELLILGTHQKLFHYGVSHTLAQIRLKYWITHGREAVRRTLKNCLVCKQYQGGSFKLPPIPVLPKERVTEAKPFQYIGIDYFGPIWIKTATSLPADSSKKAWVCLFTCLTTRAIHLEIVKDLSAAQFLDCFIRFISRRGRPDRVISDNAPHFKLTDKVLNRIWAEIFSHPSVLEYLADQRIRWIYITEFAPWQGGFYERLVGLVKCGLRKGLGRKMYTYDELNTILTQIEATVNSRPLTFIDSDPSEQCVLTPAHLLGTNHHIGTPGYPDISIDEYVPKLDSQEKLLRYYVQRQQHLDIFWKTWSDGYLLSLREKYGRHHTPRIHENRMPQKGEVVLIKEEGLPRGRWERGRIVDFDTRGDGQISAAKVLCPNGTHKRRPINLLVPLEIDPEPQQVTEHSGAPGWPDTSEGSVDVAEQDATPSERPTRKAKQAAKKRIEQWTQELRENIDKNDNFCGLFLRLPGSVVTVRK